MGLLPDSFKKSFTLQSLETAIEPEKPRFNITGVLQTVGNILSQPNPVIPVDNGNYQQPDGSYIYAKDSGDTNIPVLVSAKAKKPLQHKSNVVYWIVGGFILFLLILLGLKKPSVFKK